eukprot:1157330-Pelagomonas_calceolata.AAC.8
MLDRTNSSSDQMLSSTGDIQIQSSGSASPHCPLTGRRHGMSELGPPPSSGFPRGFLPPLGKYRGLKISGIWPL